MIQAQASIYESRHIKHQVCLSAQAKLGSCMQAPVQVSNPEAICPVLMHTSMWDACKEQKVGGVFFSHSFCLLILA